MKSRLHCLAPLFHAFFPLTLGGLTLAATVTYDADPLTPGAQDGSGPLWGTAFPAFWDGAANVNWPNTAADEAVFGVGSGAAGTIPVGTVTANRLTFNPATSGNYTLTAGTITLGGTDPTLTAHADATIQSVLAGSAAQNVNGLLKQGSATLTLEGANTHSGVTAVLAGTLRYAGTSASTGTANGRLLVGGANGRATVLLNGTGTHNFSSTTGDPVRIGGNDGSGDTGAGAVHQTAGTANLGRSGTYLEIGVNKGATPTSYGSYLLSGGTLNASTTVGGAFRVGCGGVGILTQTGGTLNSSRWFAIGASTADAAASIGVATFTGGTANIVSGFRTLLGDRANASGTLNIGTQRGGNATFNNTNGAGITLLNTVNALSATVNLNSGTLVTGGAIARNGTNAGSTATLNLNGGTLRPSATNINLLSGANGLTGRMFNGGLVVDTQAFNTTISAPLTATSGHGIYPANGTIALNSGGGAGYLGAPAVAISGGSGTGATAIAEVENGAIARIVMTSPGSDYLPDDVLTFTFTGGGATTPAGPYAHTLTAADLAANGSGPLVKTGTGALSLTANSTFTGPLVVRQGTLALQGSTPSTTATLGTPTTSGKLQIGTTANPSTLTLKTLTLNGNGNAITGGNPANSTLILDTSAGDLTVPTLGGASGNDAKLTVNQSGNGSVKLSGSNNIVDSYSFNSGTLELANLQTQTFTPSDCTLSILNFSPDSPTAPVQANTALNPSGTVHVRIRGTYAPGTWPLLFYPVGGAIGGAGFAAFQLETSSLPRSVSASLVNDTANSAVALQVTALNPLTWKGTASNVWDAGNSANWTLAGAPQTYQNGDIVLFDDSASPTASQVNLFDSIAPDSVTFNHTRDYTLSGAGTLGGSGSLTKRGAGTLTVLTNISLTGATTVSEGTLVLGDGTTDGTLSGPLANQADVVFNPAATATFAGSLSGTSSGIITKKGPGTQVFAGSSNDFPGTIRIESGTWQLGNGSANSPAGPALYEIATGTTLRIHNATAAAPPWANFSGTGTLSLNTNQAVNGSADWGNLAINTNFTGTLRIERGRVGANLGTSNLGGLSKIEILPGAQFLGFASATNYTTPIEIAGDGWGENGYPGGLRLAGNATATWEGPVTLTANSGITVQRNANFTITGRITGNYECQFYAGDPVGENGNLIIAPAGDQANSYSATRINGRPGGTITAGNALAFSSGPLTVTNATLRLNGHAFTFASLAGTGGRIGNFSTDSPATLTVGAPTDSAFSGTLLDGDSAKLSLVKTGSATLSLTGTLAYSGDTTVSAGTLSINSTTLDDASTVTIANGAKLQLDTTGDPDTVGKLVLGGVTVPPGTYSANHPAYGAFFAGTGKLRIAGSPYQDWASTKGLTSDDANPLADPDHDGIANAMEFVIGGEPNPANPNANSVGLLVPATLTATHAVFTFRRSQLALDEPGIEILPQYSANLTDWTRAIDGTDQVTLTVTTDGFGPGIDKLEAAVPLSASQNGKLFGRLNVTLPPAAP